MHPKAHIVLAEIGWEQVKLSCGGDLCDKWDWIDMNMNKSYKREH